MICDYLPLDIEKTYELPMCEDSQKIKIAMKNIANFTDIKKKNVK